MRNKDVIWGLVLMTIGVLIALRNFDIFYFSWRSFFSLWPFLLIFWGIAKLPVQNTLKIALNIFAIFIAVVILFTSPKNNTDWNWWQGRYTVNHNRYDDEEAEEQIFSEEYSQEIKKAEISIDAVAGKFRINGSTTKLYDFENRGIPDFYHVSTDTEDSTKHIEIEGSTVSLKQDDGSNKAWLALNTAPVWDINIDAGAASLNIDLSAHKVSSLNIDGGAAAIKIKLGNNCKRTKVKIDAGASDIKISIPEKAPCELSVNSVLSSVNYENFVKVGNNLYRTPGYSDTLNTIHIEVETAVSSLKVKRY